MRERSDFGSTSGTIGLIDAYCPHRRANLFWGRNEQHGLRCVYHGWKFDVNGQCTDLPNCPEGATLKEAPADSREALSPRQTSGPKIRRFISEMAMSAIWLSTFP